MSELLRGAWVIGRRDFTAVILSKAFFFFLLGPIFPLAIGVAAGSIGGQVSRDIDTPRFALVMAEADQQSVMAARTALAAKLGERRLPLLEAVAPDGSGAKQVDALLAGKGDVRRGYVGVITGTPGNPGLVGPKAELARWGGAVELILENAARPGAAPDIRVETRAVEQSSGAREQSRLVTAQAAQALLVLLTMLLAGMVLSNLVEEKTNKIIEILAAALPIDAIFLGKLVAMLAMAFIGITVWAGLALGALTISGGSLATLPAPAVGWPLFLAFGMLYFAMAYLLLGSLFLGIGAMATTVREVQTLSMPATMGQLLVFFLAAYAVPRLGEPVELLAVAIPFSSPFAMLARAAQLPDLWPHLLALGWQLIWVLVIIRIGASIFRRNVMKSGPAHRATPLWRRAAKG